MAAIQVLRRGLPENARILGNARGFRSEVLEVRLPSSSPLHIRLVAPGEAASPDDPSLPVQVLRDASRVEKDELRQAGHSFIDLGGTVHLRAAGLYLDRTDLEPAPVPHVERKGTDPFGDTASRLVRVLLAHSQSRRWSTTELAEAAEVHVSTASRGIRELRRRRLVEDESPGQGRRSMIWVPDGDALLQAWTRSYTWEDNPQLRVAAPIGSTSRFIERMATLFTGERWALTLHAGASLLAPHAKFDAIHVYLEGDRPGESLVLDHGWEISNSGKLVLLDPVYRDSVWFQQRVVHGIPVVSPLQLVLDLWHHPVRGREQARHIVDTVLRPLWQSDSDASA